MNIRKGFFRLTLILSVLCGILVLYFSITSNLINRKDIEITVSLPNDWGNKTLQEKMNSIDEVLKSSIDLGEKRIREYYEEEMKEWDKFYADRPELKWDTGNFITTEEFLKKFTEIEKENERRKKAGLKPLIFPPIYPRLSSFGRHLTLGEEQIVKTRLRKQIISDEKKSPKDRERQNYYVSSGADWKEISFQLFTKVLHFFMPIIVQGKYREYFV